MLRKLSRQNRRVQGRCASRCKKVRQVFDFEKRAPRNEMKTEKPFQPFDEVADSMANAASRLGVPLSSVKAAKRAGSNAFVGSRVHLGRLQKFFIAEANKPEPVVAGLLLAVVRDVARVASQKLLEMRGDASFKDFESDTVKITERIHEGFGLTLLVLEPDRADWFLKRSAALMENAFKSTRKGCREAINPKSPAMK